MTDLIPQDQAATLTDDDLDVFAPKGIFDLQRFDMVSKVAAVMAKSPLIPDDLKGDTPDEAYANCFLVTNQAFGWKMDPFAVAQCMSVYRGKPIYEGKVIAAALRSLLGIRLHYWFTGEGDGRKVIVSDIEFNEDGSIPRGARTIEGSYDDWKTFEKDKTTVKAIWSNNRDRQLRYRGAREWARAHESRVILGVYADDEFDEIDRTLRADRARNITPGDRPAQQANPLVDQSKTNARQKTRQSPDETVGQTRTDAGGQPAALEHGQLLTDFSKYLLRFKGDNLAKARDQFWKDNQTGAAIADAEKALEEKIFLAHVDCDRGQIPKADLKPHINDLIQEVYGCTYS